LTNPDDNITQNVGHVDVSRCGSWKQSLGATI